LTDSLARDTQSPAYLIERFPLSRRPRDWRG
jgi:hypothetical protein